MTLWKSEHGSTYGPALHNLEPHLNLSFVVIAAAASSVLLVWLVPSPLALPALGLVSFTAAVVVASFAHYSGADRHADGITLWDMAGAFALIWVAAGMLSEPEHIVQLLGHVMMAQ
jgi:O-antigen/teichoic acid export membrane protein